MHGVIPCNICGEVPVLERSYSRRLISHRCRDFTTGWGGQSEVIEKWNNSNSQQIGSVKTSNNSDYETALCVWEDYLNTATPEESGRGFSSWCEDRLHSAENTPNVS